jgi:hypothetical protein
VVPPGVSRTWLLAGLARLVESRTMADRVLRVAIDGPDAAGKTTLADALAARIAEETGGAQGDRWHLRDNPGQHRRFPPATECPVPARAAL